MNFTKDGILLFGQTYLLIYRTNLSGPTSQWEEQSIDVFKCVLIHNSTWTILAKKKTGPDKKAIFKTLEYLQREQEA